MDAEMRETREEMADRARAAWIEAIEAECEGSAADDCGLPWAPGWCDNDALDDASAAG